MGTGAYCMILGYERRFLSKFHQSLILRQYVGDVLLEKSTHVCQVKFVHDKSVYVFLKHGGDNTKFNFGWPAFVKSTSCKKRMMDSCFHRVFLGYGLKSTLLLDLDSFLNFWITLPLHFEFLRFSAIIDMMQTRTLKNNLLHFLLFPLKHFSF